MSRGVSLNNINIVKLLILEWTKFEKDNRNVTRSADIITTILNCLYP